MFKAFHKIFILVVMVSTLLLGSTLYATPIISNGSFETGPSVTPKPSGPGYVHLSDSDASTAITGWTIMGNIDYIDNLWAAADGNRSLDLNGYDPGSIKQTFTTISGNNYEVTFWLAGNTGGTHTGDLTGANPAIKTLNVGATDNPTISYFFNTNGYDYASNMGWIEETYTFTATSSVTTLSFTSASGTSGFGPALDNVSVTDLGGPLSSAVPEPATLLLLGFGLFSLAGRRKRLAA